MSNLSREARIYLALWRKTSTMTDGFEVKFPNYSLAISARQGLYRAIKSYRGRPDLDPVLAQAADLFVVSINAEAFTLTFTPRKTLEALELQLHDLGIDEADLQTHQEREIAESLDRMMGKASTKSPERSTPFYSRED